MYLQIEAIPMCTSTYATENKENYLEISTYQVSCPLTMRLLNTPNCQSVSKYLLLYSNLFIFVLQLS